MHISKDLVFDTHYYSQHQQATVLWNLTSYFWIQVVDQSCKFGILMPDLCQILPPTLSVKDPTISVEIKPKQGFILVGRYEVTLAIETLMVKIASEFHRKWPMQI